MRLNEFVLVEHVVNLLSREEKQPYADLVWDMLQTSYKAAGGFKSAANAEELVNTPGIWKLVRRNGKITAAALYKDQHGRKNYAGGQDGSPQGKIDFNMLLKDDVTLDRAWAEVSGAPEHMMKKAGGKPVRNTLAQALTGKMILSLNPDGIHYTRLIAGEPHEKAIYGFVNVDADLIDKLHKLGIKLHHTDINS
jgi:hypothetical protein